MKTRKTKNDWKKRRRIQLATRIGTFFAFVIMFSIIFVTNTNKLETTEVEVVKTKIFHLHTLQHQETLEDVAEKYYDATMYESVDDFIWDIRIINNSSYSFTPGDAIIIPIYVTMSP